MKRSKVSHIKQARRESFFYSELATFFIKIIQDDKELSSLSLSRVALSDKGSLCTVYFSCSGGASAFEKMMPKLVLYKPTLKHALSQVLHSRRCPNLVFSYDAALEKSREIEALFDSLPKLDIE